MKPDGLSVVTRECEVVWIHQPGSPVLHAKTEPGVPMNSPGSLVETGCGRVGRQAEASGRRPEAGLPVYMLYCRDIVGEEPPRGYKHCKHCLRVIAADVKLREAGVR